VVLADARVQGEGAAESVAGAIARLNRHSLALGGVDVLIVARGGGSMEDLWAFNTEIVARAIRDSRIPVVSGVGHEADTTIADLVADLRAATPTAAAQAAVPDRRDVLAQLGASARLLSGAVRRQVNELAGRLASCARCEIFRRPGTMLRTHRQQLDEYAARLLAGPRDRLHRAARAVAQLAHRLQCQHPRARLMALGRAIDALVARLRWGLGRENLKVERRLAELAFRLRQGNPVPGRAQRVDALGRQLTAYDPRAVLRRGYSLTMLAGSGELLTRVEQATPGLRITTEVSDGRVESVVAGEPARPRTRHSAKVNRNNNDPGLFSDGASDAPTEQ
jgi:exodeoxyribonuclease VII large subunit